MKNTVLKTLICLLLGNQIVLAQSAMTFVKGTNLASETLVSGYSNNNYIEIFNVSYSTTNDKLLSTNYFFNKPNERAKTGVLTFTKIKSKNSVVFFNKLRGVAFTDLEIAFAKFIPGSGYETYLNYKMKDVYVLSIRDNNDFTETIELLVPKIYIYYKPTLQPSGLLGPEIPYGWNFLANVSWNGN